MRKLGCSMLACLSMGGFFSTRGMESSLPIITSRTLKIDDFTKTRSMGGILRSNLVENDAIIVSAGMLPREENGEPMVLEEIKTIGIVMRNILTKKQIDLANLMVEDKETDYDFVLGTVYIDGGQQYPNLTGMNAQIRTLKNISMQEDINIIVPDNFEPADITRLWDAVKNILEPQKLNDAVFDEKKLVQDIKKKHPELRTIKSLNYKSTIQALRELTEKSKELGSSQNTPPYFKRALRWFTLSFLSYFGIQYIEDSLPEESPVKQAMQNMNAQWSIPSIFGSMGLYNMYKTVTQKSQ